MRRKPYTEIGIKRVPCFRCGKPSSTQWQICSLDNEYKGLCTSCDIMLNIIVLQFVGCYTGDLVEKYRKTKEGKNGNTRNDSFAVSGP